MSKLLIICGATATGKTKLAIECAKALNGEIVSADSQLVYKNLNVGTAKPSKEELEEVKHHMIDVVEPNQTFNVGDYAEKAIPIVNALFGSSKVPVVCGGTGFYINSILYNLSYGSAVANQEIRNKYNNLVETHGKQYVYDILKTVDIKSAEKLHPNETQRIIRALEIYEITGKRKSEQNDTYKSRYDYLAVSINYPREILYKRIDKRVDLMFENGLVEEVESLLAAGVDKNMQCMSAIGYKEVVQCLENGNNESTMRDIIKLNTRHYAKRQITFFKRLPNLVSIDYNEVNCEKILELYRK